MNRDDILKNGCVMPFIGSCIEAGGRFKPCCKYSNWSTEMDATKKSLKEVVNSNTYQKIREDFLNGKEHEGCVRCFKDESNGIRSMRQSYNSFHKDLLEDEDLKDPQVKVIDFGYGNVCNAACITCESSSSTLWIKDEQKLVEIDNNRFDRYPHKVYQDKLEWTDEDIKSIKVICHAQNETLINPELPRFMSRLEKVGSIENINLELSTNGQVFPNEELVDKLNKIRRIELQVSIDGVSERNDYIRYPLNFSKISENIDKWAELAKTHKALKIKPRCTISIYNVLYLEELNNWWKEKQDKFPGFLSDMSFGYVWHPLYLSPFILPDRVREMAQSRFQHHFLDSLFTRSFEDMPEKYKKLFPKPMNYFVEFTNKMDDIRSTNFKKTFPELVDALSTEGFQFN